MYLGLEASAQAQSCTPELPRQVFCFLLSCALELESAWSPTTCSCPGIIVTPLLAGVPGHQQGKIGVRRT